MKAHTITRVVVLGVGLLLSSQVLRAQEVLIVVNRSLSVSQITETELRDIFTGTRSRFKNGTPAAPVMLKGGPVHEFFLQRYVGDTPDEYRIRWRRALFTGQGAMPREFATEDALLKYVEATPGAIGYVSRLQADRVVKTLTITNAR